MPAFRNQADAALEGFSSVRDVSKGVHLSRTESFDSVDTCESSQIPWCSSVCRVYSSTASPEVRGAVHLLSLKQAIWVPDWPGRGSLQQRDPSPPEALPYAVCSTHTSSLANSSPEPASSAFNMPSIHPGTPTRSEAVRDVCSSTQMNSEPVAKRVCRTLRLQPATIFQDESLRPLSPRHSPTLPSVKTSALRLQPAITKVVHKVACRNKDPNSIKEWAALTTWLRMNLHQRRTAKREVCFVGRQSKDRWVFQLNPRLSWDEISKETKQRLRLLPKEAELAHTHKYPDRDPDAWKFKLVKYKPGDSVDGFDIALGPLVYDLHKVYLTHEVHSRRSLA